MKHMSPSTHSFLGTPNRGGKLTIVNCLLWALVALGVATRIPVLTLPGLVACWPIAWLFILPTMGNRDDSAGDALVVACVFIGMNSVLWGYGISWLLSLTVDRWWQRAPENAPPGFEVIPTHRRGLCHTCGYDLRATPERCPECGTAGNGGGA